MPAASKAVLCRPGNREIIGPSPDLRRGRIEVRDSARRSRMRRRADVAAAVAIGPPECVVVVDRRRTGRRRAEQAADRDRVHRVVPECIAPGPVHGGILTVSDAAW